MTTEITKSVPTGASSDAMPHQATESWGRMPAMSLLSAGGLAIVAAADIFGRQGSPEGELLFWAGLIVLVLPVSLRLMSNSASRRERIGLLVLLGLSLYLIKVMHSPYGFNFGDEFPHEFNTTQILQKGVLFSNDPIIPVTPFYPGLELVASALASLSGLSLFVSGLILIGLARVILMLVLFLFYEQIGGSPRYAAIAAMLYAGSSNFLFWSAQFSYQSLALPLVLVVLFIVAKRESARNTSDYASFTIVSVLGIAATVITHHVSAIFLALFLVMWALLITFPRLNWLGRRSTASGYMQSKHDSPGTVQGSDTEEPFRAGTRGPRWLAIVAVVLVAGWLTYFAKDTVNYVLPVVRNAVQSIVNIYKGSQAPRTLFQSPTGYVAPTWQRITGFASVVFLAAGVPFGLRAFWREYRKNGVALILVGMGLVYFAVLLLRFAPAAWETGNRTSEFLFIGLAFLLSIGSAELWHPRQAAWFSKAVFAAVICIIFIGGIVSGWPPLQVLQRPFEVQVGDRIFEPQGVSAARWFLSQLGPGNRLGADESNARLMLTYGNQVAFESRFPNIKDIISTPDFPSWQPQILRGFSIRYLVMDERQVSRDNIAGYFFNQPGSPQDLNSDFIDPQVYNKFENMPAVNRILDSGNLSIYDFISLLHPRP